MGRRQLRQPRIAELVAAHLRRQILNGALEPGDLLPRQELLHDELDVSPPSLREAFRILETEGLITVRRGNVGGAVVHLPDEDAVAYTVGLVLQARRADIQDVGASLCHFEPICAAMCAERSDRRRTVVPALRDAIARQHESIADLPTYNRANRLFHERLVEHCGNQTMILVVGALERLWSAHEREWAELVHTTGPEPAMKVRRAAVRDHESLVDAVDAGDVDHAVAVARRHLAATQAYVFGEQSRTIDTDLLRS